ncbi:filamentous hemagglutinin N-terminal domain-containing protein [Candidatus Parabeggiatoa sp. HSG14]|uniref:two-partner secretion domain-containing protein n=1 Tax=Candidatus Parabeggiatoa sp. HSG14 TaxID=3055593 RepID=UPI0025A8C68F|nr:filamentous hemagglutinin N-terminal domain-containing protein [Thiotrichales bacterium HSG14]
MLYQYLLVLLLLISSLSTHAEIITDSSLGSRANLPGPNYLIGADLGQHKGSNLFHSFQDFNLNNSESATFSGPNSVSNVISRVTGGNPSNIDGLIRSTIPNADMYFLNPYGIMFGPNASLDVQGSFHASTADYLRLGEEGRFNARQPSNSLLTVAPVEAFGFLIDTPTAITTQNSTLSVPKKKTLSFIGGDLRLDGATPLGTEARQQFYNNFFTPEGQINLASMASRGEIILTKTGFNISSDAKLGKITVRNTEINVNGKKGGSIFIRAGRIELNHSQIFNQTGEQQGGEINIQADQMALNNQSKVITTAQKNGSGATLIILVANTLTLSSSDIVGNSNSQQNNAGNGGDIQINAGQIKLNNGSRISSSTFGAGEGGGIAIKVYDSLTISRTNEEESNRKSGSIVSNSHSTQSNAGNAGHIKIKAGQIKLMDEGHIISNSYGVGNSGAIVLKVVDTLVLNTGKISSSSEKDRNGRIATGNAGYIEIEADQLNMNRAEIAGLTKGIGNSGILIIKVADVLALSNRSVINAFSQSPEINAGKAGEILVQAGTITLNKQSAITAKTANASGGNIVVTVSDLLSLQKGGKINTSVKGGTDDGGNVTIKNPLFVVLNQGDIIAQADEGRGGNINITSDLFLSSPNSLVDASSQKGIDGQVFVSAPETDLSGRILVLPAKFVNAAHQLQPPCNAQVTENMSSFIIITSEGTPTPLDDLQPSGPLLNKLNPLKINRSLKKNTTPTPQVALLTKCSPRLSKSKPVSTTTQQANP